MKLSKWRSRGVVPIATSWAVIAGALHLPKPPCVYATSYTQNNLRAKRAREEICIKALAAGYKKESRGEGACRSKSLVKSHSCKRVSSLFHRKGESNNVFLLIDAYVSHLMRLCLQPWDSPRANFDSSVVVGGKRRPMRCARQANYSHGVIDIFEWSAPVHQSL